MKKQGAHIHRDILPEKRAEYGRRIVHALSGQLTCEYGFSFKEKNLRRMIQFAGVFQAITDSRITDTTIVLDPLCRIHQYALVLKG